MSFFVEFAYVRLYMCMPVYGSTQQPKLGERQDRVEQKGMVSLSSCIHTGVASSVCTPSWWEIFVGEKASKRSILSNSMMPPH